MPRLPLLTPVSPLSALPALSGLSALSALPALCPLSALSGPSTPPSPPCPKRRMAALLLTLAVLALHLAALQSTPPASPPAVVPTLAVQLNVQFEPVVASPVTPQPPRTTLQVTRSRLTPTRRPGAFQAERPAERRASRQTTRPATPPGAAAASVASVASVASAASAPSAPSDASPSPRPWPVYAAVLPPTATRYYQLQRDGRSSPARLVWFHDARGYSLSLMAEGGELDGLGAASRGHVGPGGLVPERHVERRRGRDQRATNFDLDTGQVRGSGGGEPHPWPAGGQDRLSWLLQLAAVLRAQPALTRPGAEVVLPVAGPRGPAAAWVFAVRGPEDLVLADGRGARGLALHRAPQHAYDLQIDVWLDPDDHHLPLRLRLAAPPGPWESVWLSQAVP